MSQQAGRMRPRLVAVTACVLTACCGLALAAEAQPASKAPGRAKTILDEAGVRGGLIVHLGCGDGQLTAALHQSDRFVVQGLDRDMNRVRRARATIRKAGLYGPVSVDHWTAARLPYADGLVNLLVVEASVSVAREEVLRALCPGGVALFLTAGNGRPSIERLVKPWPDEIDQWTHHLHDAGGNAVARDTVVGPPRHLQWTAGPLWSRSHGWTPSVSAMVSAEGRLFYLCDETLTCIDGTVPDKWFLTARDAFSGVLLWKRPVPQWGSQSLSGTPGTGAGSTTGRFTMPPNIGKRLVAVGDTVYVTLGAHAPVSALDAATGHLRRVYSETARTDEILYADGRLIVTIDPDDPPGLFQPAKNRAPGPTQGKRVRAVEAATGKSLWDKGPFTAVRATRTQDPQGRLELAAGDGRVFVLTHEAVRAIDADTGKTVWHIDRPALPESADRRLGFAGVYEFLLAVMVYHDGVVLLAQPEPNSPHTYHTMPGTLYAFDAHDGRLLWKHAYGAWGHCTQPDVFVIDATVWTHMHVPAEFRVAPNGWIKVPNTATVDYRIQGLDLRTGKVQRELPTRDLFHVGHHHRCYRNKITERFLMASRRGVEFVDLASGENYQNHWVRSGCLLGNLPCNGLLYVAPHSCGCYIEAKLTGFNALAPESPPRKPDTSLAETARLEQGPVYGHISKPASAPADRNDWPMFRHDVRRSGATEAAVGPQLKRAWQSTLGGRPSAPVLAAGLLYVAGVDAHSLHAFEAASGRPVWSYTAGARIESPPSIHRGLAVFGTNGGRVVALRAADGALAWRFRAAPQEDRVMVHNQLESRWPVPGVLVQDGKCWFAAGRCSYLDGGIHVFALDPSTGETLHEDTVSSTDPQTGKMPTTSSANRMPGLLNDIPAGNGSDVFIRQFPLIGLGASKANRVYSTAGYLDSSWFNRTYWKSGPIQTSGLMVLGPDTVYGMELYRSRSRETVFRPASRAYRLVCHSLRKTGGGEDGKKATPAKSKRRRPRQTGPKPVWEQRLPIRVTALLRAGDTLFAAGSPDVVDPADPHGAWEGRQGGILAAFATEDGRQLGQYQLPSPPVWDGMAAVEGHLFLTLENGQIICFKNK